MKKVLSPVRIPDGWGDLRLPTAPPCFWMRSANCRLELQPKLLQVIQNGEFERLGSSDTIKVDVRIIAATNRNLEEEVRKGRFREDLWYRLNIFPITMPPLRDRLEDIPLLVDFYVDKISKRMGKSIEMIPVNVMNALQTLSLARQCSGTGKCPRTGGDQLFGAQTAPGG